ncbi:MAG: hypothetical protein IPN17_23385 [Deltaproteobacteria bacterium]|nr:hypothetical protein [Deltaproteobacteria bacterium]
MFPRPVFSDDARAAQTKRLTATEWAQPAIGVASLALCGCCAFGVTALAWAATASAR